MKKKDSTSAVLNGEEVATKKKQAITPPPKAVPRPEQKQVSFWSRRASQPTYEVVGELERMDERDIMFARAFLIPRTKPYKAYYVSHPELEEKDRQIHIFQDPTASDRQRDNVFANDPIALAFSYSYRTAMFLGDKVDGPVKATKVEADPARMARTINGAARYLGADLVGISELNPAWIYSHKGMGLYGGEQWGDPIELNHRYAISMGFAHNWDMLLSGRGNSMASGLESHHIYGVMANAAVRLASFIRALGYPARANIVSNYQVLQVPIAIDAGMGELGRLGFLMTRELGPSLRLVTVTTDLPLAVDSPVDIGVQDFCEKCKKCARVCPTNSIPEGGKVEVRGVLKWQIDPHSCYRFWHVRGGASCNACMCVCPWTKPRNFFHRANVEIASRSAPARSLLNWADDLLYGKQPKMQRYPEWLRPDDDKPSLREKITRFLLNI